MRHDRLMTTAAAIDSFRTLSTEEIIVLGMLWKYYTENDPSPSWQTARDEIIAHLTPEDGANIRSAHAARVESEHRSLPIECYAAVQWSALAEREKENMPKSAYKAAMRAWVALFPKKEQDPEVIEQIAAQAIITDDAFFDFSDPIAAATNASPASEPDWGQERERANLTRILSPILPA